ncbi:DoxX family protein [Pseudodesulfovibrio mercurii]|uniref:DoxX family protein n=1 Tax=Pseudodesulfovibrio mercurii TaxID=641491 RepID=F0JG24_9BACT|nr:MauE/DoxX family redox-associated membrane protein [Pseudodesulfovibrio mercurii]EGB15020.1 DoxX family protein [Pseudodesulfovibrio mercurii]
MQSLLGSKTLYTLVRVCLGLLFVYAGTLKLMHPEGFAVTINIYGLVSWKMAGFLSYAIPTVEILSGLGLILDVRGALAIIVAQLLGFMVVLLYAMYLGLDADCGCFGNPKNTDNAPTGPLHAFLRDAAMLAACALLYAQRRTAGFRPWGLGRLLGKKKQ